MSVLARSHSVMLASVLMLLFSGDGVCHEQKDAAVHNAEKENVFVKSLKQANPDFHGSVQVKFDKTGTIVSVRIQDTQTIKNLSPVKGMTLQSFAITNAPITDIEPLRGMKLTNVAFMKCEHLTDISALQDMPLHNATLYASRKLTDISPLKNANLRSVNCEATSVSDLSPLKGQPIYNARLCSRKISDISALMGNKTLKILDITYAHGVTDLTPLKEMPNIRDLRMDEAKVSDLSPLAHLKDLLLLSVKDCPNVRDLAPLKELESLKVLVFTPKNFSSEQIEFVPERAGYSGIHRHQLSQLEQRKLAKSLGRQAGVYCLPLSSGRNTMQENLQTSLARERQLCPSLPQRSLRQLVLSKPRPIPARHQKSL